MSDMEKVVKLAVDLHRGLNTGYSAEDNSKVLQQALIEANNGKSYLDIRDIRDGKCGALFSIVEEVIKRTSIEGLQGNEFFNVFVDYRNVAEGDRMDFVVQNSDLFKVAVLADGTQALRRQRIGRSTTVTIPTKTHGVKCYEELNRLLAGRTDINEFIAKVSESIQKEMMNEIYALWKGIGASDLGGTAYYPVAGAYSEDNLMSVVEHVEAAADKPAMIIGTRAALRKLKTDTNFVSNSYKDDLYNMGYFGKFNGVPCICVPNRHQVGSTEFVMDDKTITVVATDDKPIKLVREGQPLIISGNPTDNMDLTQEYTYIEKWGLGLVLSSNTGIGIYKMV